MQSTLLTRLFVKNKGLININDSSVFGATLVALVGIGSYAIARLLPGQSIYLQGLLVTVPLYFAQSFNQELIGGLAAR
jgi:hypothetical protein